MKLVLENIVRNSKLKFFLVAATVLFIFKMFFSAPENMILRLTQDLILAVTVFFLILSLYDYFIKKETSALSLVMNVGILNAFIFFMIIFADTIMSSVFDNVNEMLRAPGLVYNLVSVLYVLLFLGFLAYLLLTLRHFYFLKRAKSVKIYFYTMIVFFIVASFSADLFTSKEFSFLSDTFFIVSILLIFFNSLKISWIAFIVKREKIYLLILSIIIVVLFFVNMNNSSGDNVHSLMLGKSFSSGLIRFTELMMIYGGIYFTLLFFTTLFHIPTAEAFDRKAQEVSSLQYFSKLINQVMDFDDLSDTVTDIVLKLADAKAAWIMWKEGDEYKTISTKNIGYVESDLINKFVLKKTGGNINTTQSFLLEKFDGKSGLSGDLKSIAVSPIKAHDILQGIILTARSDERKFNEEEINAITTFSEYASVAIDNSRLFEQSIEKERLEKELDVAREIQKKILPEKNPEYEGLEISSVFIPAFEVGGDYYDFFEISDKKLGFVIADVSGKGISAAFIMAEVKGIFESLSKIIEQPKKILIKANQILRNALDSKTFVSAAYGLIDFENSRLSLARAGHCPVLLLRKETAERITPTGIGLGMSNADFFEETLDELKIDLEENDTIVLFTDGVTEAKNELLDDFGEKYFTDILHKNVNRSTGEMANKVIREVTLFSKNHSQYDDITLVILKWKQKIKINGDKEWQSSAPQL